MQHEINVEDMGEIKELSNFYGAIRNDLRISTTHISLYMALFQLYNLNGFKNPVNITRRQVMGVAKITGFATFHKYIKELNDFGYIQYLPSYNPSVSSQVYLKKV
jgi:hypothetical protein